MLRGLRRLLRPAHYPSTGATGAARAPDAGIPSPSKPGTRALKLILQFLHPVILAAKSAPRKLPLVIYGACNCKGIRERISLEACPGRSLVDLETKILIQPMSRVL